MLRTATKRASSCLLLLLAALPLAYTLLTGIPKMAIRHKMKERLETQLLRHITVAAKDIHWITDGKEISVNGRMFDISTSHFENGVYFFSGLFDEEETTLQKQIQKEQQDQTAGSKQLFQLFQLLHALYSSPQEELLAAENISGVHGIPDASPLALQFKSIPTPPPQAS
jgi:hypothetical protein